MVINTMNAMQFALDKSSQWTYFINISGSDYPLISPTNQRRLLASNDFVLNNRSFFSISEKDWWEESKVFRFDRLFTDTSLSFNQSSSEVVDSYVEQPIAQIANFTFAAAEAWMILHRQFVHHLLKSPFARRMLIAFSYSLEPEEHFFPSVALNSPAFNRTTVPHALRHVTWVHKGKHSGQHPYYVDERESDGKRWTFRKAIENSGCFFTRKIRIKDSALLNYIDTHVNGVAKNPVVKDVQKFLEKSRKLIDCVAKLNSVDPQRLCTGNGDVEE